MRIALLLGGPSMKNAEFQPADLIIGVNWSFLLPFDVRYNVVVDYRLMEKMIFDPRFHGWVDAGNTNFFVDHCRQKPKNYPDTRVARSTYPEWPAFPSRPDDGLYCRSHAGLSGLSLACLMAPPGETEIDIYGLDLNTHTANGNTENWHHEHDEKWAVKAESSYPGMVRATAEAHAKIDKRIKITNMNKDSAYKGFEFA